MPLVVKMDITGLRFSSKVVNFVLRQPYRGWNKRMSRRIGESILVGRLWLKETLDWMVSEGVPSRGRCAAFRMLLAGSIPVHAGGPADLGRGGRPPSVSLTIVNKNLAEPRMIIDFHSFAMQISWQRSSIDPSLVLSYESLRSAFQHFKTFADQNHKN